MSELPREIKEELKVDELRVDAGVETLSDDSSEDVLPVDTDESVLKFIESEFSSAAESEEKEAAIARLLEIVPEKLKRFGLEGSVNFNEDLLDELMGYGYEDEEDIENLYFYTWDTFRQEFGPYTRVKPEFLLDFAENIDSEELEKSQNDHATHTLIGIGVNADHALDARGSAIQRQSMRRLCWVIENEPSIIRLLETLPKPEVVNIDVYNLAEYIKNYLHNLKETMSSMDLSKMDNIDRLKHRGQMGMLRCSIAIAESILDNSTNQAQENT